MLIPSQLYPQESCEEHRGAGWEAVIQSATPLTAVVRFSFVRAPDGRPYWYNAASGATQWTPPSGGAGPSLALNQSSVELQQVRARGGARVAWRGLGVCCGAIAPPPPPCTLPLGRCRRR